jgi:hypothetical protein
MKESNWKYSDKYFHARGNYDAAQHGTGGRHAAKVIRYSSPLFISRMVPLYHLRTILSNIIMTLRKVPFKII